MNKIFQVLLGAGTGYAIWHFFLREKPGDLAAAGEMTALAGMESNPRYSHSVSRTPREAATRRCVFGKGTNCRFPVGDVYHERLSLKYVQAGRCSPGECEQVLSYLARHAHDPEVKAYAKAHRQALAGKAYKARRKRAKTRRSRGLTRRNKPTSYYRKGSGPPKRKMVWRKGHVRGGRRIPGQWVATPGGAA